MNGKLDTLVEDNLWPSGVPWDPMTLAWLKKKKKSNLSQKEWGLELA